MKILMVGTGTFAEPIFESILEFSPVGLITQPDREVFAKRTSTRQTGKGIKLISQSSNIPVFQPDNINSQEFINQLKQIEPDLVVVAAYGQILSKELISSCKKIINVHASLLPRWRGASPVNYAILYGDHVTGVTIISIEPKIDAGEILASDFLHIDEEDTAGSLEIKLSNLGAKLTNSFIKRMIKGEEIKGIKQDNKDATKAPKINKEFGLIDWNTSSEYILRFIRAVQPWPSAYTFIYQEGKEPLRVSIMKASLTGKLTKGNPGDIMVEQNKIFVATSDYFIEIKIIHPSGKKMMSGEDFIRGTRSRLIKMGDPG